MLKGMTRWLVRNVISVLLISGLTVFTTWTMMEMYMNRLLDQAAISNDGKSIEFRDLLAHLAASDDRSNHSRGEADLSPIERITQQPDSYPGRVEEDRVTAGEADDAGLQPGETEGAEESEYGDAVPVFGNGQGVIEESEGHSEHHDEFVMSTDEFVMKQEQISDEDKTTIFSLLFAKVPQHEFQHLSLLLEDGLTADEAAEIFDILGQYLSEEELLELTTIIQKYE